MNEYASEVHLCWGSPNNILTTLVDKLMGHLFVFILNYYLITLS